MKFVRVAFGIYEGNVEDLTPGYKEVSCHIIFHVNTGYNFRCKPQMLAGGNKTTTPSTLTYLLVVYQVSARIALKLSSLKDLNVIE